MFVAILNPKSHYTRRVKIDFGVFLLSACFCMGFAYIFEGVFIFWSYQTLKFQVYLRFVFRFLMVLCFYVFFCKEYVFLTKALAVVEVGHCVRSGVVENEDACSFSESFGRGKWETVMKGRVRV